MLLRTLVAALSLGITLKGLASPLLHSDSLKKREVPNSHAVHERHTPRMTQRWAKQEKLPSTAVLPMRIGLKQSNLDMGRNLLMEMYALRLSTRIRVNLFVQLQP
jgi:tripeptidyl-peptidase I